MTVRLTPEQLAARKRRNLALGLSLAGFMALVFIATFLRLQHNLQQSAAAPAPAPVAEAPAQP
ncbi:MAG: hypothetical protein KF910_10845 [Brevundimonas sp.]|uniref:hypothetical protein n=1 Tax=Brevundimonas sp. TaxID=1871086 RepID=UPI0025C5E60B|nr:hypothetical protein [Brevundimonas sp.]MBX3478099.1 hypothetical protein [Brevundimonas sp.]